MRLRATRAATEASLHHSHSPVGGQVQQEMDDCGFATPAMLASTADKQWSHLLAQLSGASSEAASLDGATVRTAGPGSPGAELAAEQAMQEPISRSGSRSPPARRWAVP